jgi:hypothetical protein
MAYSGLPCDAVKLIAHNLPTLKRRIQIEHCPS